MSRDFKEQPISSIFAEWQAFKRLLPEDLNPPLIAMMEMVFYSGSAICYDAFQHVFELGECEAGDHLYEIIESEIALIKKRLRANSSSLPATDATYDFILERFTDGIEN